MLQNMPRLQKSVHNDFRLSILHVHPPYPKTMSHEVEGAEKLDPPGNVKRRVKMQIEPNAALFLLTFALWYQAQSTTVLLAKEDRYPIVDPHQ